MKFRFSFHPKELSSLKGSIAERLVRAYLDKVLVPKLKDKFNFAFADLHGTFSQFLPLGSVDSALLLGEKIDWEEAWNKISAESFITDGRSGKSISYKDYAKKDKTFKKRWKNERIENATIHVPRKVLEAFLEKRMFPSPELFDKTIKLMALLENAPDGLIFKLSNNGKTLAHLNLVKTFSKWSFEIFEELELRISPTEIPVVSGEIEIIEIKADKAFMMPHQAESYKKIITEGYPLRYFHVTFISFEKNKFEIEDKLVKKASELEAILRRIKRVI